MPAPKTITELVKALQNAPQEKEGAFRIATWRMVLEAFSEMQNDINTLNQKLGIVEQTAKSAVNNTPDAEAIKQAIRDDINKADVNKVLF